MSSLALFVIRFQGSCGVLLVAGVQDEVPTCFGTPGDAGPERRNGLNYCHTATLSFSVHNANWFLRRLVPFAVIASLVVRYRTSPISRCPYADPKLLIIAWNDLGPTSSGLHAAFLQRLIWP